MVKTTKNRARWVNFYGLAHAFAEGTCDPAKVARFEKEFEVWINQTSYVAACWGALGSIGERANADHMKTLLTCCPARQTKQTVPRTNFASPAYEVEIDMANAVFYEDTVPDFITLYGPPQT